MLTKTNKFMNLMNLMKRKGECEVLWKNIRVIFYFYWYKTVFLGSQRFIRFIKVTMRNKIVSIVRQLAIIYSNFMNLMNVYEVRVLKANFEKVALNFVYFMKCLCSARSCRFIKPEVTL